MDVSETGDEGGRNESSMTDPLNVSQGFQPLVGACQLDDFGKVTVSMWNDLMRCFIDIIFVVVRFFRVLRIVLPQIFPQRMAMRKWYLVFVISTYNIAIASITCQSCHARFSLSGHIGCKDLRTWRLPSGGGS